MRILRVLLPLLLIATFAYGADKIVGKITAIDADRGVVEVAGVKINAENAGIEDEMDRRITLDELKIGDYIDAEGDFEVDAYLIAMEIEKTARVYDVIEGRIEKVDLAGRILIVSGVTVKIDKDAVLEDTEDRIITLDKFAPHYDVECKGKWTGTREFTAAKAELD